jgi:hypothetical protein
MAHIRVAKYAFFCWRVTFSVLAITLGEEVAYPYRKDEREDQRAQPCTSEWQAFRRCDMLEMCDRAGQYCESGIERSAGDVHLRVLMLTLA